MNWFWRTILATLAACMWWKLPLVPSAGGAPAGARLRMVGPLLPLPVSLFEKLLDQPDRGWRFALCETALVTTLPIVGILTYALLTRWFCRANHSSETLCRQCGYILRGITEPRCPECGERI